MNWWVNIKIDYGMGNVVEYDCRFTTAAYAMLQDAIFEACREPGDHCGVTITVRNREGMTLIMENMGWTYDSLQIFNEVQYRAQNLTFREEHA